MKQYLKEIFEYRELLWNLIINELKLRYRGSFLGFLWTILNPLLYLIILATVFSKIMRFQIDNYIIFLLAGLTSWTMIQQTITIATGSIVNNQALFRRVYVPKILFPLSNVLARFIDHTIMTIILVGFMVFFKMPFTLSLLMLPVFILLHFLFTLGFSLISSVVQIKIKDVQQILAIAFQALFFLTPIIYTLENIPEKYKSLFLLNPFYYFVQCFRYPVYYSTMPPIKIILIALALTIFVLVVGFLLFYKKEKYFVFHLS
ncbi:MAG: ABC transporter permease [Candidatus Aminicenantes bacterium]|nr:ABC transporter permease [Candidatus Aminicenantes bacterium]